MSFKVIKPGFISTIQDYGRLTHGAHGMSQSGVMDEYAFCWANYLLGNNFNDAVLEITFGNVELEALDDMVICVCGAELDFKVNTQTTSNWRSIQIDKGDRLSWALPKHGIRAYLAVKGGFKTPILFDSRSVNLHENIGSKLAENDILDCESSLLKLDYFVTPQYIPNYNQDIVLRLLPSYQYAEFSEAQRALFFNQRYQITNANDRTGCRLDGVPITVKKEKMISEGMSYGSVEIATDGLPIILLKDAPTIGGYPKIGTVFSLDLAKLAQKQPKTKLKFELMDIHLAQKERLRFNQFFQISPN